MDLLDQIIKDMLEQHVGGEKFFDRLDQAIQQKPIIDQLISLFDKHDDLHIICLGNFGRFFVNYLSANYVNEDDCMIIAVNGGLRKGDPIDDLTYIKEALIDQEFIFIDDSFYSGKTRDAVAIELEKHGAKIVRTYVVYDGSKVKDTTVESLYRYYN